jgi:ribulose-5-phosphate 4-epimerase/fuculose-1-phosphate aldolase
VAEIYVGTKFRTVFVEKSPISDTNLAHRVRKLIEWARKMSALGLAPDGSGNVSARTADGFIVSKTAGNLGNLLPEDFVEVREADMEGLVLRVVGLFEPSSESLMHAGIYAARANVGAILHGHSEQILAAAPMLGIPVTAREQPYGTPKIVREALEILNLHNFFVLREHGFVALGTTIEAAGEELMRQLRRLSKVAV